MSKRNVTIYLPTTAGLFRRSIRRAGGAERQMAFLARELVQRDMHVALVVNRVPDPISDIDPRLTLVERGPRSRKPGIVHFLTEATRVLRALIAANGQVVIVRGGTPVVGFVALYRRLWCRRFVFSSANDFDFLPRPGVSRLQAWLYARGVKHADVVVVQSSDQVELAREAFPEIRRLVRIASFADDPPEQRAPREPTALIWAGRIVDYKRPELFAELAASVPEASFLMIPHVDPRPSAWETRALENLASASERMPNLELGKSLPHAELVEKLGSAVAVVNTSEFEGMPNLFLEAWGQGVPVLTFSVDPGGVVAEKSLGIAADGSWDAFVTGARVLWESRFDREETAQRVRGHLRDVHSKRVVAGQWEELLRSLGAASGA
jgi:glycosyltransferase involved in cell wall biosynthesis